MGSRVAAGCGHIGLLEFHRADKTIAAGETAVARAIPALMEALNALPA